MYKRSNTPQHLVLVGLNAKYIHSNLALYYLEDIARRQSHSWRVDRIETTINDVFAVTLRRLVDKKADLYAFSCYIWNIETVLKLSEGIKKSLPEAQILLGGPEVSYRADTLLCSDTYIDYIISGEGEKPFEQLLTVFGDIGAYPAIAGFTYRSQIGIRQNPVAAPVNFESVPDIYSARWQSDIWHNRIIYYESSRGCPHRCAYCLSAVDQNLRNKPQEEVKRDIEGFIKAGVPQVKFIDRTFNADINRAKQIFSMILKCNGQTNFHFEMTPDNFDEELFEMIASAPKGTFQFEIGLQSIHPPTLKAICRRNDLKKIEVHIRRLTAMGHCHIHLDLIAGLPEETMASFIDGFNWTMALQPHMLQLGFLKVLSGTPLHRDKQTYQLVYNSFVPYEILSTATMSAEELNELRRVETVLERIYNSGLFANTLYFLKTKNLLEDNYGFYRQLGDWWADNAYDTRGIGKRELFLLFYTYLKSRYPMSSDSEKVLQEMLAVDLLLSGENKLPDYLNVKLESTQRIFARLHKIIDDKGALPSPFEGDKPKDIVKKIKVLSLSSEAMALVCALNDRLNKGNLLVVFNNYRGIFSMEE